MANKSYDDALKTQILNLYFEGRSIASLAREFGPSQSTIGNWLQQALDEPDGPDRAKLRRLKKEIEERNREIAFLKKAHAFFGKELGKPK